MVCVWGAGSAARIARKERRKHEALEDQKRLAKTKMREDKLRRMERLMEGAASPPHLVLARRNATLAFLEFQCTPSNVLQLLEGSAAAGATGADGQTALALPPVDPLSLVLDTTRAQAWP